MIRKLVLRVLSMVDRKLSDMILDELYKYSREERRALYGGNHGMFIRSEVLERVIVSLPLKLRILETLNYNVFKLTSMVKHGKN